MGIFDNFKPKWKHSDAEVRAEAVRRMGDAREEVLLQIARDDEDARVRRIALKRLRDPQSMAEVAAKDPDQAIRAAAVEQLLGAATGTSDESRCIDAMERLTDEKALAETAKRAAHEKVRRMAIVRLHDPKALADVARHGNDPVDRRAATERVTEANVLRDVALSDPVKEVSLAAIERIGDLEALEEIARTARCKWGRTAAREKAVTLRPEAPSPAAAEPSASERRRTRRQQICRAMQAAALSPHLDAVMAEMEAARNDWQSLGPDEIDDAQRGDFEAGIALLEARRGVLERGAADSAAAEAKREADELRMREERSRDEAAAGSAPAATGESTAKAETAPPAAEAPRREKREKKPPRERTPAELAQAVSRAEAACARLERVAPDAERKAVEQALKEAQGTFPKADHLPAEGRAELRARYEQARDRLQARLQELREADEWQRWSNVPKLEELCARVEALAEATDLKAVAKELKAAQTEWKTLPAPRDRSEQLWARFKTASDAAYERCREHFATLDQERAENLARKEALCVRAEALADSTEWKATSESLKKLQEEWKAIGPPPKEQADAVWKRFRSACDRFFERLKTHHAELDTVRAENLRKQEDLCRRAEELSPSTDWKATADRIKALQAEWKSVGPAPPAASRAAWNRFRVACDRFFERQKEHFGKLDDERGKNLLAKEEMCARAEEAAGKLTRDDASRQIREWMTAWKAIGPAPREKSDAVWERFRKACDRVRETATGPAAATPPPAREHRERETRDAREPREGRERDRDRDSRDRSRSDPSRAMHSTKTAGSEFGNRLPLEEIARRLQRAAASAPARPIPSAIATEEVPPSAPAEGTPHSPASALLSDAPIPRALPAAPAQAALPLAHPPAELPAGPTHAELPSGPTPLLLSIPSPEAASTDPDRGSSGPDPAKDAPRPHAEPEEDEPAERH